jgi:hypothetical protein
MTRFVPILALSSIAPVLMAPVTDGCNRCDIRLLSISSNDSSWQELELHANQRYALQMVALEGASEMQLFPINSRARLQQLRCEGDDVFKSCELSSAEHILLGVSVEPTTEHAKVLLEVVPID